MSSAPVSRMIMMRSSGVRSNQPEKRKRNAVQTTFYRLATTSDLPVAILTRENLPSVLRYA